MFEPAQIIGIVGDQYILAGDVLGEANQMLEEFKDKVSEREYETQRKMLMQKLLERSIETKLVYGDFLRTIPANRIPAIEEQINKSFDKTQMDRMLKKYKTADPVALDAKLRRYGSSLPKLRRAFAEKTMAQEMVRRNVKLNRDITHDQMLAYYREHEDDYFVPAKVRWEELMVAFPHYRNREAARGDIVALGNQVLRGAPLSAIAQRSQQGPNFEQGGLHDWTTQGSLRSEALDEALFSLPLRQLSQIIEDDQGLHILRVLERVDANRIPFTDAQVDIKKKIEEKGRKEQIEEYLASLHDEIPVWTVFDENRAQERVTERPVPRREATTSRYSNPR